MFKGQKRKKNEEEQKRIYDPAKHLLWSFSE